MSIESFPNPGAESEQKNEEVNAIENEVSPEIKKAAAELADDVRNILLPIQTNQTKYFEKNEKLPGIIDTISQNAFELSKEEIKDPTLLKEKVLKMMSDLAMMTTLFKEKKFLGIGNADKHDKSLILSRINTLEMHLTKNDPVFDADIKKAMEIIKEQANRYLG